MTPMMEFYLYAPNFEISRVPMGAWFLVLFHAIIYSFSLREMR